MKIEVDWEDVKAFLAIILGWVVVLAGWGLVARWMGY